MTQWAEKFSVEIDVTDALVPQPKVWPEDRLTTAYEAELSRLIAWLRAKVDGGRADMAVLLDTDGATNANRLTLRAWYDSEKACSRCPGLRVCGAVGKENPYPRLWAITEAWVDTRHGRPWLEVAWNVCQIGRNRSNNPRLVQVSGTECRGWIKNDTGDAPWREMPEPAPKSPSRRRSWSGE